MAFICHWPKPQPDTPFATLTVGVAAAGRLASAHSNKPTHHLRTARFTRTDPCQPPRRSRRAPQTCYWSRTRLPCPLASGCWTRQESKRQGACSRFTSGMDRSSRSYCHRPRPTLGQTQPPSRSLILPGHSLRAGHRPRARRPRLARQRPRHRSVGLIVYGYILSWVAGGVKGHVAAKPRSTVVYSPARRQLVSSFAAVGPLPRRWTCRLRVPGPPRPGQSGP